MVRKLSKVKIEDAQARKESDKAMILDLVKSEVPGGCDALNKVVIVHMKEVLKATSQVVRTKFGELSGELESRWL